MRMKIVIFIICQFYCVFVKPITLCNCLCSCHCCFLSAVCETLELYIGIPDFGNLSIWRSEVVSSALSEVFMQKLI